MMKRLSLILMLLSLVVVQHIHAQYYSVNYDARTVAAMATAFGTEAVAESYYRSRSMTYSSTTMRRKWPRRGFCLQVLGA